MIFTAVSALNVADFTASSEYFSYNESLLSFLYWSAREVSIVPSLGYSLLSCVRMLRDSVFLLFFMFFWFVRYFYYNGIALPCP